VYPVQIDSERLRLREFTPADIDGVLAIYGDPVATRHLSFDPRSRTQVEEFLSNAARSAREEPAPSTPWPSSGSTARS
jgi:[ribosomal protein S5]-alanine N-acetyltransferase